MHRPKIKLSCCDQDDFGYVCAEFGVENIDEDWGVMQACEARIKHQIISRFYKLCETGTIEEIKEFVKYFEISGKNLYNGLYHILN